MRDIQIPELAFSTWVPWAERSSRANRQYPGIYLIAITSEDLNGKIAEWSQVSYIGMTNSQGGLQSRLQQFDNAIKGNNGHSGGNKAFQIWKHYSTWASKVFVAVMPIECKPWRLTPDDLINMGLVSYLEYEAFYQYLQYCNGEKIERSKPFLNTR